MFLLNLFSDRSLTFYRVGLLCVIVYGWVGVTSNGQAQTGSTAQGDPLEIHGPATVYIGPPPSTTVSQPPYRYYATGGSGSGYTFSVSAFTNLASINAQSGVLTPNNVGNVHAIVRDSAGNSAYMVVAITSPWQDWKNQYFNGANVDPNVLSPGGSGLTNLQDYQLGLNPLVASTAGDSFTDGWKIAHHLNPFHKIVWDTGTTLKLEVFTPLS